MESKIPHEIPNLPEEIITETLSRLPVKSLLRLLCISKSWRRLISSKHFIKTHLEISAKNTTFAHHRIISTFVESTEFGVHNSSLQSLFSGQVTHACRIGCPKDKSDYLLLHLVGSCNGLICIRIGTKHFYLWNPSTRKSKKLPDIYDRIQDLYITEYGFGFDENSGDYKVYGALSAWRDATGYVYSLKTDSWKRIKDFEDGYSISRAGKFVSGNIHWSKTKTPVLNNRRWYICSFNLKGNFYGIVEQPSNVGGDRYPTLGVLGGCLSVLYNMHNGLDLWVWKIYGVKESWIKVVSIPYPCVHDKMIPFYAISEKGEVLFNNELSFEIYNPKENCFWTPQIIGFDKFFEAEVYVESLVSLVPDVEQECQA